MITVKPRTVELVSNIICPVYQRLAVLGLSVVYRGPGALGRGTVISHIVSVLIRYCSYCSRDHLLKSFASSLLAPPAFPF